MAGKVYDRWMVWNRHNGAVSYVADEKLYRPDQNDIFNKSAAMKELDRLCGNPSVDLAAIDSTP